jgi:hypothetical protein
VHGPDRAAHRHRGQPALNAVGIEDFDYLLRDLARGFGDHALVRAATYTTTIKGRFIIDPFDVSQNPADNGLNVTKTIFSYDARHEFEFLGPGVAPPVLHDHLVIRGIEYEIVKIDKDDLGEHVLTLLRTEGAV